MTIIPQTRVEYIRGLRKLADFLEAEHTIPLPYHGGCVEQYVFFSGANALADALTYIATMDEPPVVSLRESGPFQIRVEGRIHGMPLDLYLRAEDVCEHRPLSSCDTCGNSPGRESTLPAELLAVARTKQPVAGA
ncbi:hypothetical protein ACIBG7_15045 [Nonomuraea sp. NPDC050328]|uniref:hypothetical protein n=1 Tax=Nonomuraea sp. NPDC050328 TaxID=3364361 RepID=UPI0037B7C86E